VRVASGRSSPVYVLAVAVAAAIAIVALVYWIKALSNLGARASANSRLSYSDRELGGGNSVVIDSEAPYRARALIPAGSRYRVVTGSRLENPTPLTLPFVAQWFRYFLMPLRPEDHAPWVVCYGCDVKRLGREYTVRWSGEDAISIGRVR
jgi:hypothetical protein